MAAADSNERYLPARQVWERYGVADMTLYRWTKAPEMNFPKPIYIGRLRYWRLSELEAWERAAAAANNKAAA